MYCTVFLVEILHSNKLSELSHIKSKNDKSFFAIYSDKFIKNISVIQSFS